MSRERFIKMSLHMNLFFLRLIKEHLYFIGTNLSDVNKDLIQRANVLRMSFAELLEETVILSDGIIGENYLKNNDIVTEYTLDVEEITSNLTGVEIDTDITKMEYNLSEDPDFIYDEALELEVEALNCRIINLVEEAIEYKENLLESVLNCEVYITLYPELIEHTIEEEELYLGHLNQLNMREMPRELPHMDAKKMMQFWNHIMKEHAEFIDGMLDPTEEDLKKQAREFICIYERLLDSYKWSSKRQLASRSLRATKGIKDYKKSATVGLINCQIKSIIPPLLADHVLREAYHYLRMLENICK